MNPSQARWISDIYPQHKRDKDINCQTSNTKHLWGCFKATGRKDSTGMGTSGQGEQVTPKENHKNKICSFVLETLLSLFCLK